MSLDPTKLKFVRKLADGGIRAQCPACAEKGGDSNGEHLRVFGNGKFGCVANPKDSGHTKRIFALAGSRRRPARADTTARAKREADERDEQERIARRHAAAARRAADRLQAAQPANPAHPYLRSKRVAPCGELKQSGHELLIPLLDETGALCSVQFIRWERTGARKEFLKGAKLTGSFFPIPGPEDGPCVLCEGFATGASIHDATGHAVVCAMSAGNLLAVAQALRSKWPAREIFLAADNDQWTAGNPGLSKATEAAKAIGAKLAVPHFKNTSSRTTDFNDLHQLEGLETVKKTIELATTPTESGEDIIARLATLPPLDYEREREAAANKLGCRTGILDKLVEARRPKSEANEGELQGRTMTLADVEPWPDTVDGADVLNQVAGTFTRFVALPDGAADTLALWAAHTHASKSFICSPRLNVSSPEKGCGKTTLRDVLAVLVPRPLLAENLTQISWM